MWYGYSWRKRSSVRVFFAVLFIASSLLLSAAAAFQNRHVPASVVAGQCPRHHQNEATFNPSPRRPSTTSRDKSLPEQCSRLSTPAMMTGLQLLAGPAVATTTEESVLRTSSFLVRIVFLRAMAFVHFVAFLVALNQNKALIGDSGITPARRILNKAEQRGRISRQRRLEWRKSSVSTGRSISSEMGGLLGIMANLKLIRGLGAFIDRHPRLLKAREVLWDRCDVMGRPVTTLLWLAKDRQKLDPWLDGIAVTGLATSAMIMTLGAANVPLILTLWLCQRSLMSVGAAWYGYGWEPQLAEVSFHSLFLVPLLSLNPIPTMPVPAVMSWLFRWHLFRIMMGAGLIKFRSRDKKWKDLTAMHYFYETQPVPNPITRYFHWMPSLWHKGEVLINHFVEVVAPWLLIIPGLPVPLRRAGGLIQIIFQSILITSGNLSFLNWLTMLPAIFCLDDALLSGLFSPATRSFASYGAANYKLSLYRQVVSLGFLALILRLSVPVVRNLMSKKQIMNSSFDPLRLVNTYGAFGVVNEHRDELVVSAASDWDGPWKEYEFKVKPTDLYRSPRFISPYHYRLDWQMWIAASGRSLDRSPWIFPFLAKLLEQDKGVLRLLEKDPWEKSAKKPKYIRVDMFRYKFHKRARGEKNPPYWDRQFLGRVFPRQGVASIESLQYEIESRFSNS